MSLGAMVDEFRESVEIAVAPERVWRWLMGLADHYTEWHPAHVSAEWERGAPNTVGSVLRVVEVLAGHREQLRFEITALDPPNRVEFRVRGPHALVVPRGSFVVSEIDGHARFTASLVFRQGIANLAFRRRGRALRAHMCEEGEQLRRILERCPC